MHHGLLKSRGEKKKKERLCYGFKEANYSGLKLQASYFVLPFRYVPTCTNISNNRITHHISAIYQQDEDAFQLFVPMLPEIVHENKYQLITILVFLSPLHPTHLQQIVRILSFWTV